MIHFGGIITFNLSIIKFKTGIYIMIVKQNPCNHHPGQENRTLLELHKSPIILLTNDNELL